MGILKTFIFNLTFSEWVSFLAIIISIVSLFFSYIIYKSSQSLGKLQMLQKIIENLIRSRWEILNAINEIQDYNNKLIIDKVGLNFTKHVDELTKRLNEVNEVLGILRKALRVGFIIEYKPLFELLDYSKSTLISFESVRKDLLSKVKY